jgi:haloacetate dehalogenase
MFEGFQLRQAEVGDVRLRLRIGGGGPPVLLLHGNPQTHVMWHKLAPALAARFTVVASDLRGYGGSSKPESAPDHAPYSKRTMAADQLALMRSLGFEKFAVVGHDRGGRVAYRMALDRPECVVKLAVLDILPTLEHYRRADMRFALAYWHWFFLPQPYPIPERLIGADPRGFFERNWPAASEPPRYFDEAALADYWTAFSDPATVHAICEDYRAGATIDCAHDAADLAARKIRCPLLVLWATKGILPRLYEPLAVWRAWAEQVSGQPVEGGHYFPEENPRDTLAALLPFLAS